MTKITAIGNAITDVVCKVEDKFLEENDLIKGSMSLIDLDKAEKLSQLPYEKITSGGSAGNTIAALGQLGAECEFIGKVGHDKFGEQFSQQIKTSGVELISNAHYTKPSARSFILVTNDAQRTMCTFLGCASEITEDDIDEGFLQSSKLIYLEGYLWDQEETIKALKKAINLSKENNMKIAFTLSDSFCVARHKEDFLKLIENDLNILFANEDEVKELTGLEEINEENLRRVFPKRDDLTIFITRGKKGSIVFDKENYFEVSAKSIKELVDTTGAGDAFAAGALHGIINNLSLNESADFGNLLASKIIQKFGARFEDEEIKEFK